MGDIQYFTDGDKQNRRDALEFAVKWTVNEKAMNTAILETIANSFYQWLSTRP